MGLVLATPPATEPLTIAEVSAQLRLDATNAEPAPDAPTVTLAAATPGGVTAGAHRYAVSFVTADGETQLGTSSDVVTVTNAALNGTVALSAIPVGGAAVLARKLYRTMANGLAFYLLATLANNTATTYTDSLADGALGAGAPTDNTTGDPYIVALIQSAREYAEMFTRRALIQQGWRLTLDTFPACDTIELPRSPLVSVDSITYLDPAGATQTLNPAIYTVDLNELVGRVVLNYATVWPFTRLVRNAVTISFTAGFGTSGAAVPATIRHAMKMLCAHWYSQRELFVTKRFALEVPMAVDALLWSQRVLEGV